MSKTIKIPGRIESVATGKVVTGANAILDDTKGKKQNVINEETDAELLRLDQEKQGNLTFDQTPTENSTNPVTSGGVYAADQMLSQAIEAILLLIPSAASELNKLVDLATMNSSISTATASFKGTYNLVSDLHLTVSATHAQIAAALDALSLGADNNDYAFVQVPNTDTAPTDIAKTERYKFNGENWAYEYDLNNSGFTTAQWNAINSGITTLLVAKLSALPTNEALTLALAGKQDSLTFDNAPTAGSNNPVKSGGIYTRNNEIVALINALDVAKQNVLTFDTTPINGSTNPVTSNGVYLAIQLVQTAVVALDGRMGTAETKISTAEGNIANLQAAYAALTQSDIVVVSGALPSSGQQQNIIYRQPDQDHTPPQFYSDYMWNGTTWVLMATYNNAIDPRPKKGSQNLVTSGGVFDNMGALDVSELNATENPHTLKPYDTLDAALADIPSDYQKGGMSIKYVQSSDNKYVQYRYIGTEVTGTPNPFLNTYNWQNTTLLLQNGNYPLTINMDNEYIDSPGEHHFYASGYFISDVIPVKKGNVINVSVSGLSGSSTVVAKCDASMTFPVERLLLYKENTAGDDLIQNGTPKQIVIDEDGFIVISGIKEQTTLNIIHCIAENELNDGSKNLPTSSAVLNGLRKMGLGIENLCKDTLFTNWNPVQMTYTVADGIATGFFSNAVSRLEYVYPFKKDHTYFIYIGVRTNNYNKASIYLNDYSTTINLYKGDGWTPLVCTQFITSNNVDRVGFYVNRAGIINAQVQLTRPIIVDVTGLEANKTNGFVGNYPLTINMDNEYIASTGEHHYYASGYFISDVIPVKKGNVIKVSVSGLSGNSIVVAKCDASMTFPVEKLLWYNGNAVGNNLIQNGIPKQIVIDEDGFIVVSGIKEQTTLEFILDDSYAYKYVKLANNWKDITKPTKYYADYNEQRLYDYVIASKDSVLADYADIICTGENDQELINRIIQLSDCNSIYFTDDSLFNISAPIYAKSNLKLVSKGAKFLMCDMIIKSAIHGERNDLLNVDDISDYTIGMLLYINNNKQYNKIIKLWPNTNQIELEISNRYGEESFQVKTASNAIFIMNKHDVVVDGLHIDLNVANNPRQQANPWYLQEGIQIAYSDRVWVQNCRIVNGGRRGICTTDAKYFWLLNNFFDNWHEHSIDIFCGYDYSSQEALENPMMNYGVISGNVCLNNQMSGIQCHRGSGCTITGNVIKNCPHGGIRNQEHAHHNTIVSNIIEECNNGLYLGGHDINANGNVIKSCNTGIFIGEYSTRVLAENNEIKDSHQSAIRFHSGRFSRVSGNMIVNSCTDMTAESTADVDTSIILVTIREPHPQYNTDNEYNQVIDNTIIEYSDRSLMPLHIFKNPETGKKNVVVRNLCIIQGTINDPWVYDENSDIVKDNDIIS